MNPLKAAPLAASILLLTLSLLVPSLSPLTLVALVPYLLFLRSSNFFQNVFAGLLTGIIFFSVMLYWINLYEIRIFLIVLGISAPFFVFFSLLTTWAWKKTEGKFLQPFVPAVSWSTITFFYGLTPVGIIGDQIAMTVAPSFPGIVRMLGISGIAFLVLLSNSLVAGWIETRQGGIRNGFFALALLLLLGTSGKFQLSHPEPIRVALIQHNFPVSAEWRKTHEEEIVRDYENAIRNAPKEAELIVFPQYGLPRDVLREPEWLQNLAERHRVSILLATYIPKIPGGSLTEGARTDSALLFSPGKPVQEYQAMNPPPFRNIGQIVGRERNPLQLNERKIGVMLCYEDVRPDNGRSWISSGAEILVALSNPGHFMGTSLPRYHLLHDRIRAIETGRYVIRVSPNGFSAVIDPTGKILAQSQLNRPEILTAVVYPSGDRTFFSSAGPWIPPVSTIITLGLLIKSRYARDSMIRRARRRR